jgi:MFS family permease
LKNSEIKKWKKLFFKPENQLTITECFIDDYIKIDLNTQQNYPKLVNDFEENSGSHKKDLFSWVRNTEIFRDLVDPKFRLQMYLVILLNLLNQLTGINIFQLYSTIVFKSLHYNNPQNLTIALGFMHLFAGLITNQMIERFGRKTLISLGLFSLCVCFIGMLSSFVFTMNVMGLVFIFGYKISFCMAAGGSILVYQSEILPAHLIPFGIVFQSIFVLVISYTAIPLINFFGIFALFAFFLFIGMIGFVLFYGFAVETKAKKDSVVIKKFLEKKFWK